MGYMSLIKVLGGIVALVMLYKGGYYYFTYMFFKKLEKFIKKDLKEKDVKYIANELNKYKIGRNSYNWSVLAETVIVINKLDIDKEIVEKINEIADEKGLDVKKVLEYNNVGE